MNLDTYIAELEKLRQELGGDVRVVQFNPCVTATGAIRDADSPTVQTLQVKRSREAYEKVFSKYDPRAEDSGVKVMMK